MARRLAPTAARAPQKLDPPRLGLAQEQRLVTTRWCEAGAHSEQSLLRMTETVRRFAARLAAEQVRSFADADPTLAAAFVLAPLPGGRVPEVHTQHARRTALRVLFRTLRAEGLADGDPTLDLALLPRGQRVARPLTEDEVTLCRATAQAVPGRSVSMRAVAWALGEASAGSAEITQVRVLDLDDPANPSEVRLRGTRRADPRVGALTAWGRRVIAARVLELGASYQDAGSVLLAYGGHAPAGGAKAQASVCNALRDVLDTAGLGREADVRPSSLRHWAGRRAFDAGAGIAEVARLLGHRSLDAAAQDIAWDWTATSERGGR